MTGAGEAAAAAVTRLLEAPAAEPRAMPRRRPGVPVRQRGRTGTAQGAEDFNAKHKRTAKGRAGGGQFAKESAQEHEAQQVQKQLRAAGLYGGPIDGRVGPMTTAAIRAFQQRNGLDVTGQLDERTRLTLRTPPPRSLADVRREESALLDEGEGQRRNVSGESRSSRSSGREAEAGSSRAPTGVLRQGAGMARKRGDGGVRQLQTALQDLGYDLGAPGADGKFGPITARAVKAFQQDYGLRVDGVIGRMTRRVLDLVAARSRTPRSRERAPLSADEEPLTAVSEAGRAAAAAVREALAERGAARARHILRLPDGTFAPKGQGRELTPGGSDRSVRRATPRAAKPQRPRRAVTTKPSAARSAASTSASTSSSGSASADLKRTLAKIEELGLNDWPPISDKTRQVLGDAVDTQQKHAPNGVYTAERKKLHDRIIEDLLGGHAKPSGKPQALFMAGGAASGKSTALAKMPEFKPADAVEINPDDIKERLPEYQALLKLKDRYAATAAHEESSDLAARLMAEAIERGLNVIVDGTGDSKRGKFAKKLQRMNDSGYDVRALYVTVPTDVAVARAVGRAERTGRFVPVPELRTQHRNVSAWFEDVATLPFLKGLELMDTSTPEPTTLASAKGGKLRVRERAGFAAFKEKAKDA